MKLLSIAAVAFLAEASVSIHITEPNEALLSEPKLPILDSNFGMNCYSENTYGPSKIKSAAAKAYSKTHGGLDGLERCTFDRFPGETLFLHRIGSDYVSNLGVQAQHYIMINSAGQFLAGMLEYELYGNLVHIICQFTHYTTFSSYEDSRRLRTQGDELHYASRYGQASQQPPIGSRRGSHRG
ncbi:Bgt_BCG-5 [Blumeria graminis f. sp. tritici]|uniref:Bgt_BCG-5 n=2 Tax=Blumeria graminis f. sp. tritici TaxID=62690 RepID=A0A061HKZ9_BLUGR|nr:hypothetical protein BGT96224_BCG5 [Blumeria graminis f. sp. tritici 96224]VCU41359.1 Bgt_BCG-5 [Blumeria graminis f. sp. tritici]